MARNDGSRRRRGGLCDRLFGDLSAKKLRKVLFGAVAAIVTVAVVLFVWNGVVKPVFDNARTESTISVESQLQAAVNIDDLSTAKFHYGGVAVKKDNAGKDIISIAASNLEQTVDALTKDLVEAKGYKLQKAETVKLTKETAHADE